MFTTGFSMNVGALAEPMEGKSMVWMAAQAQRLNAVVAGSLIIQEETHYFNRLIWMLPSGAYQFYDKRHLFTMAQEHLSYTPGKIKQIFSVKDWRVCPLICYDLRFPVWSRNTEHYDLLLYVANWPVTRSFHWKALLQARAIENQAYTMGVNRIGKDGNGLYYTGDSTIISPSGEIYEQVADVDRVVTRTLSASHLQSIRQKFPFLNEMDKFEVMI
jgi:predicted amidohydrolase